MCVVLRSPTAPPPLSQANVEEVILMDKEMIFVEKSYFDKLVRRMDDLEKQNAHLRGEIQRLGEENVALKRENADLKRENAELKRENADLKRENADLKSEMQRLGRDAQPEKGLFESFIGVFTNK